MVLCAALTFHDLGVERADLSEVDEVLRLCLLRA